MKREYSNKYGFTLIELLATVTLLGIILALTYPKILEIIERKETQIDDETFSLITNAADQYMITNINEYPKNIGATYCFDIDQLDRQNLIPIDIDKYQEKGIKVKIGKNNQNSYTIIDKCE